MNSVGIWRGPSFHGQSSLCCVKVNQPIHFTLLLEHKKYFSSLCEISLFPTRIRKKNWAIFRAYSILNLIKGYVRILAGNKENDKTFIYLICLILQPIYSFCQVSIRRCVLLKYVLFISIDPDSADILIEHLVKVLTHRFLLPYTTTVVHKKKTVRV